MLRPLVLSPCGPRIVVYICTQFLTSVGAHDGLCYGLEGEGLSFEQDSFPIPFCSSGATASLDNRITSFNEENSLQL